MTEINRAMNENKKRKGTSKKEKIIDLTKNKWNKQRNKISKREEWMKPKKKRMS